MRMRLKKWARPELEACPFYIRQPEEYRGRWAEAFRREAPLELELGCGKGVSTALMALENPGVNLVAVDINSSVLGVAKRNAEFAFADRRAVDNLKLMNYEIELISRVFAPEDAVRRIYISFPNPWTQRHRQEKHRLTHTRLLNIYRGFMADGGEIWFKTDNDELFEASLSYFPQAGFEIKELTRDLHAEASHPNYISEHEKLFSSQGIPIKALIAVKR
ncbi:MAG: tRNA (guanosine(46)-N7)-methyltransferase TrmB [Clostridia bacterium]|nr:tRNA (guanosine(46)-N7)-methyltransferase TrmB [Clostridia bacterium]MBR5380385.1 tRNA (guanosine(46)-N7)-methyltransferase TrmB [Clostridia bacterium]